MFNFLKKKNASTSVTLKLSGLHCSSCSLNIDSELEDLPGVIGTSTSYAKQETKISYDPNMIHPSQFVKIVETLGYKVIKQDKL